MTFSIITRRTVGMNICMRRFIATNKPTQSNEQNNETISILKNETMAQRNESVNDTTNQQTRTQVKPINKRTLWRRFVVYSTGLLFKENDYQSTNKFGPGYKGTRERFSLVLYIVYTVFFLILLHYLTKRFLDQKRERRERFFRGEYSEEMDMKEITKGL